MMARPQGQTAVVLRPGSGHLSFCPDILVLGIFITSGRVLGGNGALLLTSPTEKSLLMLDS